MISVISALIIFATFWQNFHPLNGLQEVIAPTSNGRIRGMQSPRAQRVTRFLGVHYADKPNRFEKAVPVSPWQGIRDATQYGPSCYQFNPFHSNMSEDCLSLDIYTPAELSYQVSLDKKPVMVYTHGGSFTSGGSDMFEGSILSDIGDVIVVVLQYRLGMLGFLYTDDKTPSNLGLWDQKTALEWIQGNIQYFGGDNSKVTLFGDSSGSVAVSCLVISPELDNSLFQKAILQSGTFLSGELMDVVKEVPIFGIGKAYVKVFTPSSSSSPKDDFHTIALIRVTFLAENTSCTMPDLSLDIDCLKAVDVSTLIPAMEELSDFPFWPQKDNDFLPYNAEDILMTYDRDGENGIRNLLSTMQQYDVLVGINGQEGLNIALGAGVTDEELKNGLPAEVYTELASNATIGLLTEDESLISSLGTTLANWYEQTTPKRDDITEAKNRLVTLIRLMGDNDVAFPSIIFSKLHAMVAGDKRTYFYLFDHKPEKLAPGPELDWLKTSADHGDLIWILFAMDPRAEELGQLTRFSEEEQKLIRAIVKYWANFAKSSDPNEGPGNVSDREVEVWQEMKKGSDNYLHITTNKDTVRQDPGKGLDDFMRCIWTAFYKRVYAPSCPPPTPEDPISTTITQEPDQAKLPDQPGSHAGCNHEITVVLVLCLLIAACIN